MVAVVSDQGGPDYGRFVEAVRTLQDHARAVAAPDDVITKAAELLDDVNALLAPYDADEQRSPSGKRLDLPMRGSVLPVPMTLHRTGEHGVGGQVRFRRYHLGRGGAAHGGAIGLFFDSICGATVAMVTGDRRQRTAFLHVNYRSVVPIERELDVAARVSGTEGRKIFVAAEIFDGDRLLADAEALFVRLRPGQV